MGGKVRGLGLGGWHYAKRDDKEKRHYIPKISNSEQRKAKHQRERLKLTAVDFSFCELFLQFSERKLSVLPCLHYLYKPLVYFGSLPLCAGQVVHNQLVWAPGLQSYCPHFYEQRVGLPGTNIDPVTSQLEGANNNSRKLLIFFSVLY